MNKIFYICIGIVASSLLLTCGHRGIETMNELEKCKIEVMEYANPDAYIHLTNYYFNKNNYYELLPYSIKMLDEAKCGYSDFFNIYLRLRFKNKYDINNFIKLRKEEKELLLSQLKLGIKEGDFECNNVLKQIKKMEESTPASASL